MALPSQIIAVPIVGTFEHGDGTPHTGTATATASIDEVLVPAASAIVTPPVVQMILDGTGSVSLPLWSTDNSATSPTGWTWTVSVALDGIADPLIWDVVVPGAAGTVALASIPKRGTSQPAGGSTIYATQAGVTSSIASYIAQNGTSGGVTLTQVDTEIAAKLAIYDSGLQNGAPSDLNTLGEIATRLQTAEANIASLTSSTAAAKPTLVPTAVLTANTTVGASDYALCNPDGAAFTITAPASPADKTIFAVKHVGATTAHAVTVSGGTFRDFNGTATSLTVGVPGQWYECQYSANNGEWEARSGSSYAELATLFAPASGSANYASAGSVFKLLLAESGAAITSGMDLRPNGVRVPGAFTIGAFSVELDIPANGAQTWRLVAFHADETNTVVSTVTVASLTRSAVATGLSYSVLSTDRLLVQNVSTSGTYAGQGVTASVALGAGSTLTVPAAPATPTGLTAVNGTGVVNLSWASSTNATAYLVAVDGVPTVVTSNTSYAYPVTAGASHTYQVAAMLPGAMSALSSAVTTTAWTSYSFFSQSDGAPSGWTTFLGGTGAGQTVSVTGNVLHLISGNSATGQAVADRVGAQVNADSSTHSLWDVQGYFCLDNSTSIFDLVLSANAMTTSFPGTNLVQFEFTPSQGRIGIKAGSYTPPSQAAGSFYTPTYSTTPGATSGYANYPITVNANGTNFYGFRCRVIDPGDGTLTAQFYMGTTAQLDSGTLPLFLAATLPSGFKTANVPGFCWIEQYGGTATAATQGSRFKALTVTPTTVAGA